MDIAQACRGARKPWDDVPRYRVYEPEGRGQKISPKQQKIIDVLKKHPDGLTGAELSKLTGITRPSEVIGMMGPEIMMWADMELRIGAEGLPIWVKVYGWVQ